MTWSRSYRQELSILTILVGSSTAQPYRQWDDVFPNGPPGIQGLLGDDSPPAVVQYGLQPSCNNQDSPGYDVCLDLVSVTGTFQPWMDIFAVARTKWQEVIVGDLPAASSAGLPTGNQFMCTEYPSVIDDIYLCGKDSNIDGAGGILGGAAPLFGQELTNRPNNPKTNEPYFVSLSGIMEFDVADINREIQNGRFEEIVKHEIGHVIGVGSTLWEINGVYTPGSPTYESDTNAEREWHSLIGCTNVGLPVELDGGQGTAGSHWDETCLRDEIMTGFISGVEQPFSRITVGTLEDMGYVVDYSQADPFSSSELGFNCRNACRRRLGGPIHTNSQSPPIRKPQRNLSEEEEYEVLHYAKGRLSSLKEERSSGSFGDGIIYIGGDSMDVFYLDKNKDLHVRAVTYEEVRHL